MLPRRIPSRTAGRVANGVPRRFVAEVALVYQGSDCLEWPFAKSDGYGNAFLEGRNQVVSRYVCEKAHGAPPPKHEAAHSCGNRGCVNPNHIRWATSAENMADKVGHGRHTRGERHRDNKLTEQQVREILASEKSLADLGREYGVTKSAIQGIKSGKNWRHLHDTTA